MDVTHLFDGFKKRKNKTCAYAAFLFIPNIVPELESARKKVFFPSLVLNCATIHDKRESQLSDNVLDYAIECIVLSLWDDHISERHYGKLEKRMLRGLGSSWAVSKNL